MDFQNILDNMSPTIRRELYSQSYKKKDRENLLILYTIENNIEQSEQILKAGGVPKIQFCKSCIQGRQGFKGMKRDEDGNIVDIGTPLICPCVLKMLRKREGNLLVDWENKKEEIKW